MRPTLAVAGALARVIGTAILVAALAAAMAEISPGTVSERAARAAGVLPADDSAVPAALRGELIARVAALYQLDAPFVVRLARQSLAFVRGDFGTSWRTGAPIRGPLARSCTRSAVLISLALALALALGVAAGLALVILRARPLRFAVELAASVFLVLPPVWIALLLLGAEGAAAPEFFAVVAMALLPAAVIARHARAHLEELAAAPYAVAARARGVSERRLLLVHGGRLLGAKLAALVPGLLGYLIGAAMVIETVFGLRGFGAGLALSAASGDAPAVIAAVAVSAGAIAAAQLVSSLVRRRCDPRLAEEAPR